MRLIFGLALLGLGLAAAPARADVAGAGFDVLDYEVSLRPDLAARTVAGRSTIRLRVDEAGLRTLVFTDNALSFDAVAVDGRSADVRRSDGLLRIDLPSPARAGLTIVVTANYRGAPGKGVTFSERSVHTEYFACAWMLCAQEAFGDKAPIRLALTVPAGTTTLGPGVLVERRRTSGGEEVHHWRERRPYPAFTVAFAAGDYTTAVQRAGKVELAYLGAGTQAELQRLFAPTAGMLAFFEGKAGTPFPQRRYSQLLVEGAAAQEAASHAIIGRAALAPMLADPQDDWVIAHELAHQWWGNRVTARSLDQFWLNEGVTTFMVAAWKEHRWGRAAYDREMELARGRVERAAVAGLDVPLTYAGAWRSLGVRRAVQYSKGALFLDALRRELGEDAFWAGLRGFTQAHDGQAVDSRQFQAAFETAARRNLDALFEHWVY